MLILNDLSPWHWALGGLGIAVVTILMLAIANKRLGISTGFESLCSLGLKAPYFQREGLQRSNSWRLTFLVGLVLGGFLSALLSGGWSAHWRLGLFDLALPTEPVFKALWMFGGGLLIGFGTRLAGGCTSGHGIFGIANLERSGFVATISFMVAGILTTNLIYRVFLDIGL